MAQTQWTKVNHERLLFTSGDQTERRLKHGEQRERAPDPVPSPTWCLVWVPLGKILNSGHDGLPLRTQERN